MRTDAIGLFWEDLPPPPKVKKEKIKRTPPERVWERLDYLPGLEEALSAQYNMYTQQRLVEAVQNHEPHVYDIECYPNYFLIAFLNVNTFEVIYFEMYLGKALEIDWLNWIAHNMLLISFNGIGYDVPILTLALAGADNAELKTATDRIIVEDWRASDIYRHYNLQKLPLDHIDLMEVAPGAGGLKVRMGRLHRKRLQDLPFQPNLLLTPNHMAIVRHYCVNDLDGTLGLYQALKKDIKLREILGQEYGLDLRSRSDPQIAEDVIKHSLEASLHKRIRRPQVEPGKRFNYKIPDWMRFQTPMMNSVLDIVRNCQFVIEDNGSVKMPWQLSNLKIAIADSVYRMGIGGLHSSEECAPHPHNPKRRKRDVDVTSYYPSIIIQGRLFPAHLGPAFLKVFTKIVVRRVNAKHAHDDSTAQTLKIVINGTFGKLGSMWSILYAPELLIQVTITGQLALLMLIETMELCGVHVLSANTDGIVLDYPVEEEEKVNQIIAWWEQVTGFNMESNYYKSIYSANVNNYIAITECGKIKCKGWFAKTGLQKNPTGEVIIEAVVKQISEGIPVERTINDCQDVTKFLVVRQVKGGAYWNGEYLGKVVRWYYGAPDTPEMVYAQSGNKVAGSDRGVPMMELLPHVPADLDRSVYVEKANSFLKQLGYL